MKALKFLSFTALFAVVALAFTGCDSAPTVAYPVTYRLPIGNSTVTSAYGPQNLNVNATQDVSVPVGQALYYSVVSPVNLQFYVFDKTSPAPGGTQLSTMQGSAFASSVTSQTGTVEFVFSAAQANTGGTVTFTISDRPLAPPAPMMAPNPTPLNPNAPQTGVSVNPSN
jgi:hypothetical protein